MEKLDFILGLMRQNYDAVGFIPSGGVQEYLNDGDYIIQYDYRGQPIGYLLHGPLIPGSVLRVSQHCIDYDSRLNGYGTRTFNTLIERARQANMRAIKVRCADDLPSVEFWQAMGLEITRVLSVENKRKRNINVMLLDLWPTLWGTKP